MGDAHIMWVLPPTHNVSAGVLCLKKVCNTLLCLLSHIILCPRESTNMYANFTEPSLQRPSPLPRTKIFQRECTEAVAQA